MNPPRRVAPRARLLAFPASQSPAGGRLDALHLELNASQDDLVMDYQELLLTTQPVLFEQDGKLWEQSQGEYLPRRLRFPNVQIINGGKLGDYLETLPPDAPERTLASALTWCTPQGDRYILFVVRSVAHSSLLFIAGGCLAEMRPGPSIPVIVQRDWSPTPLSPPRLVPAPGKLHQRYGGDPVAVWLDGRLEERRLFTGGLEVQGELRPQVAAVLNVGETPSRWTATNPVCSADRWENKGEGSVGMNVEEITAEARWVIERLRAGQRVLVHCAAGMNRSSTICCAVLILLEGLSAEAALERVREHHPWARPDPFHWLALKWLAQHR